jgi:sporulation protein YlmC with PRC-barrel domain
MFLREVFFSQLYHRKVEDVTGRRIGLLRDVVVSLGGVYPKVVGLGVGAGSYIPIENVAGGMASDVFCVTADVRKELAAGEYEAAKLLLDKQVLDCAGRRVYRVNDIVFVSYGREDAEERSCFAGVEVGIGGICRRVGLSYLAGLMKERLIGYHRLAIADEGDVPFCLKLRSERLGDVSADDIGAICRQYGPRKSRAFLRKLPCATVCHALMRMPEEERMGILVSFEEEELFLFLRSMSRVQRDAVCRSLPRFCRYRHDVKDERVP